MRLHLLVLNRALISEFAKTKFYNYVSISTVPHFLQQKSLRRLGGSTCTAILECRLHTPAGVT